MPGETTISMKVYWSIHQIIVETVIVRMNLVLREIEEFHLPT
jgi:hypothetical protein